MNTNEVEKQFTKDTAEHVMEVLQDYGLYRSVIFKRPGTGIDSFTLTTWPGYLCFSGDRGTYVFCRVADMFEFFHRERPDFSYWAEKCVASDRDGIREYDPHAFRRAVLTDLRSFRQSSDLEPLTLAEVRRSVQDDVLCWADEGESRAVLAALDFDMCGFRMDNFYENTVTKFTYSYMWCCHAIHWGVTKYRLMAEVGAGGAQ